MKPTASSYFLISFLVLLYVSVSNARTPKGQLEVGFSIGRVSEGQFEYDSLNGRMTPRYKLLRISFVNLFWFQVIVSIISTLFVNIIGDICHLTL